MKGKKKREKKRKGHLRNKYRLAVGRRCVWGAQIQERVTGTPCSPREGVAPHIPPESAVGPRRCTPPLGQALPAPFLASVLRTRLSPRKRGSQERCRRDGRAALPQPASPHLLPTHPSGTCRLGGSEARGVRLAGPWGLFAPSADEGSFSFFTLFKCKATAVAPQCLDRQGSGGRAPTRP